MKIVIHEDAPQAEQEVRLALRKTNITDHGPKGVQLCVVDKHGQMLTCGRICTVTESGTLYLYENVAKATGLRLDSDGGIHLTGKSRNGV